jgi:hypothetical protein
MFPAVSIDLYALRRLTAARAMTETLSDIGVEFGLKLFEMVNLSSCMTSR